MKRAADAAILVLILVLVGFCVYFMDRADHWRAVAHDQQVYIDAGCRGRYQGEEP